MLEGHPAFILGNGPALPEDLSGLADFFTVGVNRILERFDPTFIMWLDADVTPLVEPRLADAQAVPLVRDEVCSGPWLSLTPAHTLQGPTTYIDCKNSGVSAAYWAVTLGCRPIYLLGMSATYQADRTNFYGCNRFHVPTTLNRLRRAAEGILRLPGVFLVPGQAYLDELTRTLRPLARGRRRYLERLARLCAGQRPLSARR